MLNFMLTYRLYEGTVIHHIVWRMKSALKLKKLDPPSLKRYRSLLAATRRFAIPEPAIASDTQQNATASSKKKHQPLTDLTASLKQLFLLYDDDDEEVETEAQSGLRADRDVLLSDLMLVRTKSWLKKKNKPVPICK